MICYKFDVGSLDRATRRRGRCARETRAPLSPPRPAPPPRPGAGCAAFFILLAVPSAEVRLGWLGVFQLRRELRSAQRSRAPSAPGPQVAIIELSCASRAPRSCAPRWPAGPRRAAAAGRRRAAAVPTWVWAARRRALRGGAAAPLERGRALSGPRGARLTGIILDEI